MDTTLRLHENNEINKVALDIYQGVKDLPLVCPHGHVPPSLFSDPDYRFGSPAELLIIPDHYILRMMYSQGVPLESLGVATRNGTPVETDHRKIWQRFADRFYIFRGTPTGLWLKNELAAVFGIEEKLTSDNAQTLYDQIEEKLSSPEFQPKALYEQFNIEVLVTTDAATDTLEDHKAIQESGWAGKILPTFRPDAVMKMSAPDWKEWITRLSEVSGIEVNSFQSYINAIEQRRAFFKSLGATATDHDTFNPHTEILSEGELESIFQQALSGKVSPDDAARFFGHMLVEMARMSSEDGLVMQLHVGSYRNHNQALFNQFGPDVGGDLPVKAEFTRNLKPLLDRFGSHPGFRMILFTLDESAYSRELAPLAGHYPAVKLGPPWWFHDSVNGIERYLKQVVETAGIYNTAGFNDDTRAFLSIPARHDVWRRVTSGWVASLLVRKIIDEQDAAEMAKSLAYDLARDAYHLNKDEK